MKKKILALIILILALTPFAYAEESENTKVTDLLVAFNLIEKNEISNLDNIITRGEFAEFASRLIPYELEYPSSEQKFADVPKSSTIYNSIMMLEEKGIINGVSAISFRPDEEIKLNDACAIMVRILGYDLFVKNGNYISQAASLEITKSIALEDDLLTKNDALTMMYNALFVEIEHANNIDGYYDDFDAELLMEKRFNIYETSGIVTDDGEVALASEPKVGGENIKIAEQVFIDNTGKSDFVGRYVRGYYTTDKDGADVLIYAFVPDNKNEIIKVVEEDIKNFENDTYEVYKNSDSSSTKTLKLDNEYVLIYNNRPVDVVLTQERFRQLMVPVAGDVTLIDNNTDNKYDVVIVNSIRTLVVKGYQESTKTIFSLLEFENTDLNDSGEFIENSSSISFDKVSDIEVMNSDGVMLNIDSIAPKDVVSVMMSADGSYAKVVISSKKVSGVISTVNDNGEGVTIDDVDYKIADELQDLITEPRAGKNVTAYLRHDGRIAYLVSTTADGGLFAYIHYVGYDSNEEKAYIKIVTQEEAVVKTTLSDKIVIDGNRYKNLQLACDAIKNNPYSMYGLAIIKFNEENEVISVDTAFLDGGEEAPSSRNDNDINSLQVSTDMFRTPVQFTNLNGTAMAYNKETKIFIIPVGKPLSANDSGSYVFDDWNDVNLDNINLNEIDVTTINNSYLGKASWLSTVYQFGDDGLIADAVVIYRGTTGKDLTSATQASKTIGDYVAKKIVKTINEENEICYKITYLYSGKVDTVTTVSAEGIKDAYTGEILQVGDLFKVGTNAVGQVPDNQLVIMYRPGEESLRHEDGYLRGVGKTTYISESAPTLLYGKVEKMDEEWLRLYSPTANTQIQKTLLSTGAINVVLFEDGEVSVGDWTHIETMETLGDAATPVVASVYGEKGTYLYIVR